MKKFRFLALVSIPYVLPPGIERETLNGLTLYEINEQALSMKAVDLPDGDARAVYKNTSYDLRQFNNLQMFVHAEDVFSSGDLKQCIRVKLLKSSSLNTKSPLWKLMMKNVYNLSAYQVSSEKFRLNVLYTGDEDGIANGFFTKGRNKGMCHSVLPASARRIPVRFHLR